MNEDLRMSRRGLIVGAAVAMVHQMEVGHITATRSAQCYVDDAPVWTAFSHLSEAIRLGKAPPEGCLEELPHFVVDGLALLRQSMRVGYDEWFSIFPWLDFQVCG